RAHRQTGRLRLAHSWLLRSGNVLLTPYGDFRMNNNRRSYRQFEWKDPTMREELLLPWLTADPEAYDRMAARDQISFYFSLMDVPLLAASRGRVLEVACGTGRLLPNISARPNVQHVVGLDIAPRMLAAAAARGHRRLVQASAEALPFAPGRFDTVLGAVHSLRDLERSKVYTEVARVLRPRGRFGLHAPQLLHRVSRDSVAGVPAARALSTLVAASRRGRRCGTGSVGLEGRRGLARERWPSSARGQQRALPPFFAPLAPPGLLAWTTDRSLR